MIQVYDRNSKECYVEKEFGKGLLEFLYGNPVGRIILKTFIINKFYSKIKGMRERSKSSRKKIAEFIKEYDIDMTRYEEKEYKSFDEFFTRRLRKTPFRQSPAPVLSTTLSITCECTGNCLSFE